MYKVDYLILPVPQNPIELDEERYMLSNTCVSHTGKSTLAIQVSPASLRFSTRRPR